MTLYQTLKHRGYIAQETHELQNILDNQSTHFYVGYDPTADSLHVGHFLTMMAASLLQKHGHTPIILVGGGTGRIGDPSGRTDMRQLMTPEIIDHNVHNIKQQLARFINFEATEGQPAAIMVNNADWLNNLNYLDFLRDYGHMFAVNRMIKMDAYKNRMTSDTGLSFLEFNYMIMQAYDFLELHRRHGATLQVGGSDQWSNILAGVDLIRRCEQQEAYGLTLSLLVKADGTKMGKTAGGALWLDANKTSPYEFYQYFRNVDDADVIGFLKLLTFISDAQIDELAQLTGRHINTAKEVLAHQVTQLVHGEVAADKAQEAAKPLFGTGGVAEATPTYVINADELADGVNIIDLCIAVGFGAGRGEIRRLITQNGIKVNGTAVVDEQVSIDTTYLTDGHILLQKGKKTFMKVTI